MPNVTVREVLDRFERDEVPALRARTQRDYARHLNKLRAHFGHRDVKELGRKELLEFLNVKKGPIQRNRMLAVLSSALSEAVKWGLVESNVCIGIPRNRSKGRDRTLTMQEFEAAKKIAPLRVRLAMDLAMLTQQTQSNIIELRWGQVNYETGLINFKDRITEQRTQVPLDSNLRDVLAQCEKIRKGAFVLSRRDGGKYTSEGFRALWQRVMRKWETRGEVRFTFHDIKRLAKKRSKTRAAEETEDTIAKYPQFDTAVRAEAAEMARHYKVFYCLEQSIRKLIINTMEAAFGSDWWDGRVHENIRQEVDSLKSKEIDSGMTQRSEREIDYTTFGQLSQIIIQNWDIFGKVLKSKGAVANVMAGLNRIRGPIAHFSPMSEREVARLEVTVGDWFGIQV